MVYKNDELHEKLFYIRGVLKKVPSSRRRNFVTNTDSNMLYS